MFARIVSTVVIALAALQTPGLAVPAGGLTGRNMGPPCARLASDAALATGDNR